ncbi:MAG: hydrogenase expression/formation protein HypE [Bacteroidetes bacterium]|nr:hydrogenase expression/formation protein HypE [Bacteroidota bacterium]
MSRNEEKILLSHGNGGRIMHELITNLFFMHFGNRFLKQQSDSVILPSDSDEIAFTTDSFVIDPLFFPGGDIGKLAVCGTVNDLSVSGAEPLFISVSFIIEEGFPMKDLVTIVKSLADEAKKAGVLIVTGDTKVVNKGKCDKLFINTSGIGRINKAKRLAGKIRSIRPGDLILINGPIGEHGMAVMNARESFNFKTPVKSDCACLNHLIREVLDHTTSVKFMRDPTRGGVATVLNELTGTKKFGISIDEPDLPVGKGVRAMCELLGFDPLYVANEGKVVIVAAEKECGRILEIMKKNELGKQSAVIGKVVSDHPGKVVLKTETGGKRIIDSLTGDPLPRIC